MRGGNDMEMNAVLLSGKERLEYIRIEAPAVMPGTVKIKVAVCGICGSDLPRVFNGAVHQFPLILGHEFSGVVEAVGEGVVNVRPGDHVVAAPLIPCGTCKACQDGNYALCQGYSFLGSRQPGAMADYVVVPEANVIGISKNISFKQAATVEPSTVALHAFLHSGFSSGKSVAILGCGIIGLYAIQWARLLGASKIAVVGRGEQGLAAGKELGADILFSTKDYDGENLPDVLSQGFDYVYECVGAVQTMQLALMLVAKKGVVCFIGTPKVPLTFPISVWEQMNRKECWATGAWMSYSRPFPGKEWSMTISNMASKRLKLIPGMLHGCYPMEEAPKVFRMIREEAVHGRILLCNANSALF